MNNVKSKYGAFIATFISTLVIFSMYVLKFISKNQTINSQIIELAKNIDLKNESITLFLIIISGAILIILFIINLIINNIIFKIIRVNIDSIKLGISILISYNFVFLLSIFLLTYTDIKLLWLTLVSSLFEIIIMVTLLNDELGKSKYKYILFRLVLVAINMLISYLKM